MKKFFEEFKKFISKGNVMDMAVGIIIGGAFTSIVSSLVNDIINPVLGLFGGMNFDQLAWNITGDVTLYYGKFITAVVNFLIMALIVFLLVRIQPCLGFRNQNSPKPQPKRHALSANLRSQSRRLDAPTVLPSLTSRTNLGIVPAQQTLPA